MAIVRNSTFVIKCRHSLQHHYVLYYRHIEDHESYNECQAATCGQMHNLIEVDLFMQLQSFLNSLRCPPICCYSSALALDIMVLMNFQVFCPCGKALHASHEDVITWGEEEALRSRVHQHGSAGKDDHMTISWDDILRAPMECWSHDWKVELPVKRASERTTGVSGATGLQRTRQPTDFAAASSSSQSDRLGRLEDSVMNIAIGLQRLGEEMYMALQRSPRSRSPRRGSH